MSIDDVSVDTRIRATLVRAIEADDFGPCGGSVYARGHIRSIARVLGIDPEPLIAEFDVTHHVEHVPIALAPPETDAEAVSRSERGGPNWTAAMAAALVVICVIAIIGFATHHGGGHGPATNAQNQTQPSGAAHPSTIPTSPVPTSSASTGAVAQLPGDRATMLVRAVHGKTWVRVTSKATGTLLFEGTLPAGSQKLVSGKQTLVFTIGNAPAVDLVVNGHDIGPPPSVGSVANGEVAPGATNIQQA